MFEFFFKYPMAVFSRGTFVLLGGWPRWVMWAGLIAVGLVLAYLMRRRAGGSARVNAVRQAAVWLLQTLLVALLLLMLWHPALSIATLRAQQNIVAVLVDDSASMAHPDEAGGATRRAAAVQMLNSGLLKSLQDRFQVRLYRLTDHLERFDKLEQLTSSAPATHIGDGLKQVVADAASLPIGAVVLASDGSDNSGGIDLETIGEIRRQRIPIHTIGFGREKMAHDVEITEVQLPARALPESRLAALVSFHQHGYSGTKVKLTIREGSKVLAARDVTFKSDGVEQTESVLFNAGPAGVKSVEASIEPLPAEENGRNNKLTRLVNVDNRKPKILYFEGEPRWEFKFLKRAVEDDHNIELITALRTTQNKFHFQFPAGWPNVHMLDDGFPSKIDDLFMFDGLILCSVEAAYLTANEQDLIRQFVDRRGGGLLFLGGLESLADGGYVRSIYPDDLLPVTLPDHKGTFVRDPANVELTAQGRDSLVVRIEEDPEKNVARWNKLPYLMNFQDAGQPKPGAIVLADALPTRGGRLPLLITQNFGRGRTAAFGTAGSWRRHMLQRVFHMSHELFYQQLLRWLGTDTPRRLGASAPRPLLA